MKTDDVNRNVNDVIKLNNVLDVNTERLNTYVDFLITLVKYVFETFPGDDVINVVNEVSYIDHFKYCWDRAAEDFEIEGLYFKTDDFLFDLFYSDMVQRFYHNEKRTDENYEELKIKLIKTYNLMLNPIKKRDKESYSNFVSLYYLFEKNIGIKH